MPSKILDRSSPGATKSSLYGLLIYFCTVLPAQSQQAHPDSVAFATKHYPALQTPQLLWTGLVYPLGVDGELAEGEAPVTRSCTLLQQGGWLSSDTAKAGDLVTEWWQRGELVYRPDIEAEDLYGELAYMQSRAPIRAVVDVPFAGDELGGDRRGRPSQTAVVCDAALL